MTEKPPEVRTINAGQPFVDVLAAGIRARVGDDPADLAAVTVLLPTRRACRSLAEAFLRISGGKPLLLPRLTPLGDVDEEEVLIEGWHGLGAGGEDGLSLPPAISGMRRQLLLTRLIMARDKADGTPEQAARLAQELARLLDQVHTERLDFSRLPALVTEKTFADHWRVTLDFLEILTDAWPKILNAEGVIDPADRRNRLLDSRAALWRQSPPPNWIIAAGSTGTIPATADLLDTVARLPRGAVVLPGLDRAADDDVWNALEPHHPQYGMARLLERIGVERRAVGDWSDGAPDLELSRRDGVLHGALRPAAAGGGAVPSGDEMRAALSGLSRVDCPGPREEAAVIGLAMRRVLEQPGRTAALVTPDRRLARRVAVELRRWDIAVDDSAGRPLAETPIGALLRLCAQVAASDLAPVPLLALCKHPLVAGGRQRAEFRHLARRLEISVLRGPRPAAGIDGLRRALADDTPELRAFVDNVGVRLAPLRKRFQSPATSLVALVKAHIDAAEGLAETAETPGAEILWGGDDGDAAAAFVSEIIETGEALGEIAPQHYPALFETLLTGRVVRPRYGAHPRLFIWGLLEARLQRADLMILGGLNEASWPPEIEASPWMSRPMMSDFGLPSPERRIGLTAHDFVQGFAAPEVMLTRAERIEGAPTVPCRWLRRLDNLIERVGGGDLRFAAATPWLDWANALDTPSTPRPAQPPRPTPPVETRPDKLSVTAIETLIRDPYAIYAGRILRLRPLDRLDADPGAADRGTIIHDTLDRFLRDFPAALPDNAEARLQELGREVFDSHLARPGVRAFWWPRFVRIARWFVANEHRRRVAGFETVATEAEGALEIIGGHRPFTLTARADRIDRRADVGLAIIDYKTGQPPSDKQIAAGLTPQLPLEAAIALAGAFKDVAVGLGEPVAQLMYMRLSGGRQPGQERAVKLDVEETVEKTMDGLRRLLVKFDAPSTPYLSRPRPMFESRFGDYDHLARVKEWRNRRGRDG